MTEKEIISGLKANTLSIDDAFQFLNKIDINLAIIHFNGLYALGSIGIMDQEEDWVRFIADAGLREWRKTPKEAIIAKLEWDFCEFNGSEDRIKELIYQEQKKLKES